MYNKTCEVLIRAIMFSKETNSVLYDLLVNKNFNIIDIRYNNEEQYIEILYVNDYELGAVRVNVCYEDLYKK